jgi:hypothetical protein
LLTVDEAEGGDISEYVSESIQYAGSRKDALLLAQHGKSKSKWIIHQVTL